MKEILVLYEVDDEQVARLEKLLPQYDWNDGVHTIKRLFQSIMLLGGHHDINDKLDLWEGRKKPWQNETPTARTVGESR